ncbi:ABC transporter permease [Nocardiopsis ansamitocini]|uniref:ABC transporter permease n=1 Tax=Nocardiopsis ansamitocini TaxID=1670832 RepID=A0A9W6P7C3_9ACTN|nr:FtsX-like permease family protein [Nocardiopsis ansamitocini]GLU48366.1 ABC transporter permease [Nocardiopsis ansamitocini]
MLRTTLAGLRLHKSRYVTTVLAIVLGVVFVTGTMVFADTLKADYERSVMGAATSVDAIATPGLPVPGPEEESQEPVPFTQQQLEQIRALPQISDAGGMRQSGAVLLDDSGRSFGTFPPAAITVDEVVRFSASEGELPSSDGEIALAASIADQTGFGIGDTVTLLDQEQNEHAFTVTGLLDLGLEPGFGYRGALVLTPESFKAVTGAEGYFEIDALAADGVSEAQAAAAVETVLGEDAEVATGTAFGERLADDAGASADVMRAALLLFALIAVFVAGIVIYNTFAILIAQRQRELALLRCVGAARGQVFRSVLAESFVVGLLSSAIGVLAGMGVGLLAFRVGGPLMGADAGTSVVITPLAILTGLLVGTATSTFSAMVPAVRATRVPPLAALRTSATATGLEKGTGWIRVAFGLLCFAASAGAVALALAVGPDTAGLFAVAGAGMIAFVGVVVLGPLLVRGIVRLAGVPLRRVGVPSMLAVDNSIRSPRRAATAMIALTVGATLITGYSVLSSSIERTMTQELDSRFPSDYEIRPMLGVEDVASGPDGVPDGLSTVPDEVRAQLVSSPEVETVFAQQTTSVGTGEKEIAGVDGTVPVSAFVGAEAGSQIPGGVVEGDLADLGPGTVAVAETHADTLGLGDTVTLEAPAGDLTLEVAAVVESSSLWYGLTVHPHDFAALAPEQAGDSMVVVRGTEEASAVELRDAVYSAVDPYPTLEVFSTSEIREEFTQVLETAFYAIAAMLGLAIVIAVFGISNTMALSVLERTRESALLRALGLEKGQLRRMLGTEAVMLCLIGAGIGIVLGIVFGWAATAALLPNVLLGLPLGQIAVFIGVAVLAGLLASLLPARRAAATSITGALASE